ncbi:DUF3311 domain-containing protein [Halorubrum sp. AD140]|uniref:DUF3311 domain-containing protein n=1 Tax=Halorubrum sp. AD140 TaxID=3050073 RepID=UPI002ACCFCB1|nr:DUF3311 domain-containing protein [Halorubrum sp. AD140]MDZ5810635.1 DUF3311 domain-containing protein [Halorubrum sp. AD140]
MARSRRDLVWIPTFALLVALAVPWPLWGVDRVVAGLPVWIWWHVAWLGLCAVLFAEFVRSGAWERGMGLRPESSDDRSTGGERDRVVGSERP